MSKKPQAKKTPKPNIKKNRNPDRVPMHASVESDIPPEANDPDYYYRKCADYGKGRLLKYEQAGYEYVMRKAEDGTMQKIMYPGGHPRFLMRLPIELRKEDELAKAGKVIDTNAKHTANDAPQKNSVVPDWTPKEAEGRTVSKDHLS